MKKGAGKKLLIDIVKGILLVISIWIIVTFVVFVLFAKDFKPMNILLTSLLAIGILLWLLIKYKKLNLRIGIFAIVFAGLLFGMLYAPLNSNIPQEALDLNNKLSSQYEDKYEYARALFLEIEKKYNAPRMQYLLEPWKIFFMKDFEYFWNLEQGSYADCSAQGRMYQKLLLESKRFSEEEAIIHYSFCSAAPHVSVKIIHPEREEPIWADLWAVDNFPGLGSNKTYKFGMRPTTLCDDLIGEPY